MITGKELEETAAKSSKKVPALLSLDGVYRTTIYDWQAIAAEISPKPLTMEELIETMAQLLNYNIKDLEIIDGKLYFIYGDYIVLNKLLDLINKQKEGI